MHGGQHGMSVDAARYVDEDREPASNERVCQPAQGHDPTRNHIEAEKHRTRQKRRSVQGGRPSALIGRNYVRAARRMRPARSKVPTAAAPPASAMPM